jgi:O-antigen/teichoic acid export membrane protein
MRVKNKPLFINAIYIFISVSFLALYYLMVDNMSTFFEAWSYSIVIGLIFAILLYYFFGIDKWTSSLKRTIKLYLIYNKRLFKDGLNLTVISVISTILLSVDRIYFINIYNLPKFLLGNIQLADNVSNVFSLGFGSILFIITPKIIAAIYENKIDHRSFYRKGYFILLLSFVFIVLAYFPLLWLVKLFFPTYSMITYPLFLYLILKFLNLGLFIPSILSMVFSKEMSFVKIGMMWIFFLSGILYILKFYITNNEAFYFLPIAIISVLTILHIHLGFIFNKKN